MSVNTKMEFTTDRAGVSAWLMDLAAAFNTGELVSGENTVDFEAFKGLKLSFKRVADGAVRVKLSAKYPAPQCAGGGAPGDAVAPSVDFPCDAAAPGEAQEGQDASALVLPKYKSLKKHMKQTFKSIGAALAAGQQPPALEARSFIADSLLMIEYQGKGDEFYDAYRDLTRAFEAALADGGMDAIRVAYDALAQTKRDCHSHHA